MTFTVYLSTVGLPTTPPKPASTRPCDNPIYYKLHTTECRDVFGEGAIDIFFTNIEGISMLIVLAIVVGLMFMVMPGGKRR
jgi:hypothetical protein